MSVLGAKRKQKGFIGSEESFRMLYDRYYSDLVRRAYFYLRDLTAAEDVVQEVFTRLWGNRSKTGDIENFQAYLMTLVRNGCLNYLQHRKVMDRFALNFILEEQENDFPDPEKYIEAVGMLIARLPEKRREVLRLNIFEGKSYAEIGQTLGVSLNTVRDHMKKAYAYLRNESESIPYP